VRKVDKVVMSRWRGWLIGFTAASLGVVYGYDLSNIAGALLFITDEFGLTTRQQELVTMLHSLGGAGTFVVFGVLAVAGFAFAYRYAPETKGRQLEEIRDFWENDGRWPDEFISTATDVPACR
jgi:MFS transporter, SP family, galactose:H+ symporter